MKAVLTRVTSASVMVQKKITGKINHGLLILLGIQKGDEIKDVEKLAKKIISLRIFNDEKGMNKSIEDVSGEALIISQFTLCANTKKGRRPNFSDAEKPSIAMQMYEKFCKTLNNDIPIQTGQFGAHMEINSTNDGPVTIILDTKD
jgi:D-tyrosyl-tRNA(Tyr) deacylase